MFGWVWVEMVVVVAGVGMGMCRCVGVLMGCVWRAQDVGWVYGIEVVGCVRRWVNFGQMNGKVIYYYLLHSISISSMIKFIRANIGMNDFWKKCVILMHAYCLLFTLMFGIWVMVFTYFTHSLFCNLLRIGTTTVLFSLLI